MNYAEIEGPDGGDCAVVSTDAACYPLAPAQYKTADYAQGSVAGKME